MIIIKPIRLLFAAASVLLLPAAAHANLITNGNFSSSCASAFCTYNAGDTSGIPGWTVTGSSVDLITNYWQAPPGGGNSVDLDGSGVGGLSESFTTHAGSEYELSFELSGNPDADLGIKTVQVDVGGVTQTFTFDTATVGNTHSDMHWVLETLTFTATGTSTTLKFASLDDSGSEYGPVIGNVDVEPVPEPGTLALLGVGLLVMGAYGRRKSRNIA